MKKVYLKPKMEMHDSVLGSFLIGVSNTTTADPTKPTYAKEFVIEDSEGGGSESASEDLW
jgi:hypothetical protein